MMYKVYSVNDNGNSVIYETTSFTDAIEYIETSVDEDNQNTEYIIYDSFGIIVYETEIDDDYGVMGC